MPPQHRGSYIAICGPIGVGKTELARIVAAHTGASYVPEAFAENDFLPRLYQPGGTERWGLACEMAFLPHRYDQIRDIERRLSAGESVVTDWVCQQNLIYSRITLSDEEFGVYEQLFQRLMQSVPVPDRLVCLDAEHDAIMERIRARGRSMEAGIDPGYIAELQAAYRRWRRQCPVRTLPQFLDTTHLPIPFSETAKRLAVQVVLGETLVEAPAPSVPLVCRR
jgi:deoxyguanosine kinase